MLEPVVVGLAVVVDALGCVGFLGVVSGLAVHGDQASVWVIKLGVWWLSQCFGG